MKVKLIYRIRRVRGWLSKNRVNALAMLLTILLTVPVSVYLVKRQIQLKTKAALDSVNVYFNPASVTLPVNDQQTVSFLVDARTNSISFVRATITFDQSLVEIIDFAPSEFITNIIELTSVSTANEQGKLTLAFAIPPQEESLVSAFAIAHFAIVSKTSNPNVTTQITLDQTDSQFVDNSEEETPILSTDLALILNYTAPTNTPTPTQPTPTSPPSGSDVVDISVSQSSDDAEENSSGGVGLTSSDLELVQERSTQTVGIRFNNITLPKGSTITNAYIQFQTDETDSEITNLTVRGQAADNPSTFTTSGNNISSRPTTSASVSWNPSAWNSVGERGSVQRTTDLSSIIQQIVNRNGWNSGNSLVFIITGSGKRVAESYNGSQSGAPLLHVEYTTSATTPTPTTASTPTTVAIPTHPTYPGICSCRIGRVSEDNCNTGYNPVCVKNNSCKCQ